MFRKSLAAVALVCLCLLGVSADDLDEEMAQLSMKKIVRAVTNQTKADSMNLPSNATSIRENITDTFSCEGRTYGYYADVDNECQIFHVCLPSRTTSGRNTTYKWSFICPEETVFNQEVLVCTRPRDSIDCADSPMYYDLNMDIGKVENDTNEESTDYGNNKPTDNSDNTDDKPVDEVPKEIKPTPQLRKRTRPNKRGQSQRIVLAKDKVKNKEIGHKNNRKEHQRIESDEQKNMQVDMNDNINNVNFKEMKVEMNDDINNVNFKEMKVEMNHYTTKEEITESTTVNDERIEQIAEFEAGRWVLPQEKHERARMAKKMQFKRGRGSIRFRADV